MAHRRKVSAALSPEDPQCPLLEADTEIWGKYGRAPAFCDRSGQGARLLHLPYSLLLLFSDIRRPLAFWPPTSQSPDTTALAAPLAGPLLAYPSEEVWRDVPSACLR